MLQIQGGLLNTFFKPNGFCVNLLTRTFRIKNDKYPKKVRVVGGGGIFPINSVQCFVKNSSDPCRAPLASKRSVEMRAQKQVVSGQSVKSNAISVVLEQPKIADAVLAVFYFQYLTKLMLRYETYTRRHCSVR